MTVRQRISEGPDRCRGSVRCRQFHDLKDQDLEGNYNCCCCDPCLYIRPNNHAKVQPDWSWRCRCVPRIIYLKFTPDNPSDSCCNYGGIPLFFNHYFAVGDESFYGSYHGTIYGLTVRADICENTYTGTGTGSSLTCVWRVRVWSVASGSLLYDEITEIDHNSVTCLSPPSGIIADGVEGPDGCVGYLTLTDVPKARLPFIERLDVLEFNSHRDPRDDPSCYTGTGTEYLYGRSSTECQPMFIDLSDSVCGSCTEVCSRICVSGPRHLNDDIIYPNLASFVWFELWNDDGNLNRRGWSYYNEVLGRTEYIYLCSTFSILVDGETFESDFESHVFGDSDRPYWKGTLDSSEAYIYYDGSNWALMIGGNLVAAGPSDPDSPYGDYVELYESPPDTYVVSESDDDQCYLKFRFEESEDDDIYEPTAINTLLDGGCSCGLQMVVSDKYQDPFNPRSITVRCGYCSCWKFFCGTCRCVPAELCVIFYWDGVLFSDQILYWDETTYSWTNDVLTITLEERNGVCTLVPSIVAPETGTGSGTGTYEAPEGATLPTWSCSNESVIRQFDVGSDVLTFLYEDWSDLDNPVFIVGSSLTLDCGGGECDEATPCYEECGSHPKTLYLTLTQYRVPGDQSIEDDPGEEWEITIPLYYAQTVNDYVQAEPIESSYVSYSCWYTGIIPARDICCWVKVELRNGYVRLWTPSGVTGCSVIADTGELTLTTETCDPYYGDTGEIGPTASIFIAQCIGFTIGDPTRYRIVITE